MNVTPSLWQCPLHSLSLCEGEQAEWYRTGSVKLSGIITTHCGPACWSSSSNLLWGCLSTAINRFYALSPWVVHSCCCIHSLPNDCVTASPIFSSETMGWSSRTLEWSCLWEVCCTSWVRRFHADAADCKFNNKKITANTLTLVRIWLKVISRLSCLSWEVSLLFTISMSPTLQPLIWPLPSLVTSTCFPFRCRMLQHTTTSPTTTFVYRDICSKLYGLVKVFGCQGRWNQHFTREVWL